MTWLNHPDYVFSDLKISDAPLGQLNVVEENNAIPFAIKRVYWITNMGKFPFSWWVTRGNHAHRTVEQVFFCPKGRATFYTSNPSGEKHEFYVSHSVGVYMPPMWWHTMHIQRGSVALALASDYHDEAEYIRSYEEFTGAARNILARA